MSKTIQNANDFANTKSIYKNFLYDLENDRV